MKKRKLKQKLKKRIKELEADNKNLAAINCNFCLEMACLKSANRALQARVDMLDNKVRRMMVTSADNMQACQVILR